MNYNSPGFNSIDQKRPRQLLKLLKKYGRIIYSDIDTVWLKDPRPYLIGDYDFWAQIDGVLEAKPYVKGFMPYFCTGLLALNGTETTLNLMKKWQAYTENNHELTKNQVTFQRAAFELSANARVLPSRYFPSGRIYFEMMGQKLRSEIVIVHNNFIVGKDKKIQRFKHFGLWNSDRQSNCTQSSYLVRLSDLLQGYVEISQSKQVSTIMNTLAVYRGKDYLTKGNLFEAAQKKANFFQNDNFMELFFEASLHWKMPSMQS